MKINKLYGFLVVASGLLCAQMAAPQQEKEKAAEEREKQDEAAKAKAAKAAEARAAKLQLTEDNIVLSEANIAASESGLQKMQEAQNKIVTPAVKKTTVNNSIKRNQEIINFLRLLIVILTGGIGELQEEIAIRQKTRQPSGQFQQKIQIYTKKKAESEKKLNSAEKEGAALKRELAAIR